MSLLLTGAAGFVGSHLAERFLASGESVVGIDSMDDFYSPQVKESNLRRALDHDGFAFVRGDIRDRSTLDGLPPDIDAVVHLAARAGVRPSLERPELYASVNELGTWTLLEWARSRGIRRIVFASSSSVYGNGREVPFREDQFVGAPISPYAASKRAGELACHTYFHAHGMAIVALRLFTVYGPRQRPDLAIHKFARLLAAGRPLPMYGDGRSARDYTYVDDVTAGIGAGLEFLRATEDPLFEIVNIGENRTVELSQMIEILAEEMGVRPTLERLPMQTGDVERTFADISKARAMLGYDPRWGFREGVREFLSWFSDQ